MPVTTPIPIRRLSQTEFGKVAYDVMEQVFAIHTEYGRFFNEGIYKRELANRLDMVSLEVPVDVSFRDFNKRYYLDVLVGDGAVFEFKCVEELHPRHRAQLLHYLLLLDLSHGKLINMRPSDVRHEFVNTNLTTQKRTQFCVNTDGWSPSSAGAGEFEETLTSLLSELGTGLDLEFYEEALTHCFGHATNDMCDMPVSSRLGSSPGTQPMMLISSRSAFKLSAFQRFQPLTAMHLRRQLQHLPLEAIQWANITHGFVTLSTILK